MTPTITADRRWMPAITSRTRFLLGVSAAFLIQAGLLAAMVVDRALLLSQGTEIRLPVVPVDPRDFLRGDYVILSYPISRIQSDRVEGSDVFTADQTIYVALVPENGSWRLGGVHAHKPGSGVFLKGNVESVRQGGRECAAPCRIYEVTYNLEKFFVPEGQGVALEQLRADQRLEVDVAVAADGRAAIKRLLVDGAVRYDDTLF
jgi:uncharacterized membrane-anchored protein